MNILDAVAAFLVGGLSGMGIGGGTLLVIFLTLVRNVPQLQTQGTNLLFFLFSAGAALPIHLRRRKLPLREVALAAAAAVPASLGGFFLAGNLPEDTVRMLFAVLLLLSGGWTLCRTAFSAIQKKRKKQKNK